MRRFLVLLLLVIGGCSVRSNAFDHPFMVCWLVSGKPFLLCAPVKEVPR